MEKVVFVVLHYETIEDTRNCINSLLKYITKENVEIVVVDNGSTRGKMSDISKEYEKYSRIHMIYSDKNLGFAKGNNLGFIYAKETLKADIIILANNDLIFEQEDFISVLLTEYKRTQFDVAGGKIISLVDSKNQNPVPVQYTSIYDVKKRIFKFYILDFLSLFNIDTTIQKKIAKEVVEYYPKKDEDFQLHGACMIFANKYIEKFDGLYDKTFMYGEESILKYLVTKHDMKMKYFTTLTVFHKEGSSTGAIWGKGKEKRRFYYRWSIESCKLLKNLMTDVI